MLSPSWWLLKENELRIDPLLLWASVHINTVTVEINFTQQLLDNRMYTYLG